MAKQPTKEKPEDEEESSGASHDEDETEESDAEGEDDSEERDSEEEDDEDDDEEEAEAAAAKPSVGKSTGAKTSEDKSPVESEEDEDEDEEDEDVGVKPDLAARSAEDEEDLGEEEEVVLPTQLGTQRYIFAAYFVGGMLMAYVIGRAIHGIWSHYANRDFFVSAVPQLAAIPDESKQTYATILAALITLVVIVRTYRKPDVKKWTEEVTTEMTKVKWPSRKEVTSSTIVVITASAIATTYLFLLDRLWAFVTGLVYGAGT